METEITINDLSTAINEIRDRLPNDQGWSTPSVIIFTIIGILIALFIFFVLSEIFQIKKRMKDIEVNIKNISIDTSNLDFIKKFISLFFKNDGVDLTTISSPITLNERGKEISRKIQADVIIERNYESFKKDICKEESINAYDIQQNCFDFSREIIKEKKYFEADEYENMKSIAFDEGITIESMYIIFGILLRDRILEDMQLPHDDIDKHDPTTTNSTTNQDK